MSRPRIALLSNPKSTGNLAQLPKIRAFCANHPDIFHYEVEKAHQIGAALRTIARVRPKMLVINGGDGTVQAALTELHNGGSFGDEPPPVAVLPSGKTNLIALDLGAQGDPIRALEQLLEIGQADLSPHLVARELIALRCGAGEQMPVIGMFLGGAGLADTMLYCRHKIYPLGLPNGISHVITAVAVLMRIFLRLKGGFLPPGPSPLQVSSKSGRLSGRFSLLAVTTLEKLLLSSEIRSVGSGSLKLIAIDERPASVIRAFLASLRGKLGGSDLSGVHVQHTDEISIEGESSDVILDGETFRAEIGRPITLRPAQPLSFVRIAA
ncbi:MAG: diacylglycerol/lipid kinase family protein [Sphingomicrobium sp.]